MPLIDSPGMKLTEDELARIKLLNGFYAIERDPQELTAGLIVLIPKSEDQRNFEWSTGRIIKVGQPERNPKSKTGALIPQTLKVGERVAMYKFAGHDVDMPDGRRIVIAGEPDIMFVFEEPKA